MEIVQQRLEREYDIDLIVTAPSVVYKVKLDDGKKGELLVDAPSKMPDLGRNDIALEPYVRMEILTPSEYNGAIIELGQERRGDLMEIKYLTPSRSTIVYELPLAEVITDFFNVLKSATKGYGMYNSWQYWARAFWAGISPILVQRSRHSFHGV
jgi:GTP-binding protein LepA